MSLPTLYQQIIHISRYSRWIPEEKRRETWQETVKRYFDFFQEHLLENHDYHLTKDLRKELEAAVYNLEIVPSMRCMMTAGEALKRDNVCAYNCSFIAVDTPRAFDEALYILMNGVGVGFSVERQFVSKLPSIPDELFETDSTIVVLDSKLGWAKALKELLGMLYIGQIPKWDLSKIRPAGSPLKTFGGRASGPEPLNRLFKFCIQTFTNARGRKLQSIECHDLMCVIGDVVVSGGVRRSALLSLSNVSDDRMRSAKSGQWWETHPHRALSNNSACYTEKPDMAIFMSEWKSLYDSKSGERGIFNRDGVIKHLKQRCPRRELDEETINTIGCNPCSEILLQPNEFCNLSEVICRKEDDVDNLKRKIRLATILGTFQSTLTNFKYLKKEWKTNCEDERLLGVSLTGVMDCSLLNDIKKHKVIFPELKEIAIETNKKFASQLKINQAKAITCVKPSGTVSQLSNASSGIHPRFSEYYIRTIRMDNKDPLTKMLVDSGIPSELDVMKPDHQTVFSFPIRSPQNAIVRKDLSAVEQLDFWLSIQLNWCEHKPSVTINIKEDEWLHVAAWVYEHFNEVSGVSFLPHSNHVYKQAPYQECTKEEYNKALEKMPTNIDWSKLRDYEDKDNTMASKEFACTGNSCDIL
jgi:ribonucleoside-diphosphate reductase alpha chain